jgi:cephalosporin-C deacetylase
MNNIARIFIFSLLFLPFNIKSQVKITLDRATANYAVGELAVVRIASNSFGKGSYDIYFDPKNSNSTVKKGEFTIRQGQSDTVILFTIPSPGVVFFKASQNNGAANIITIAFSPLSIQPAEKEPSDFDAFWAQQKKGLQNMGLNPQLTLLRTLPKGSKLYSLQLNNVDNRKVYGYLAVPSSVGKHPAVIQLPPFGDAPVEANEFVLTDFAERCNAVALQLTVHNAPPNQTDQNAYKPSNLLKAEEYYNRYMITACLQAAEYLAKRDDFNGSLGVTGNSQGAGLAMTLAGLDSRVSAVIAANPASSDQQAFRFNKASGFPSYVKQGLDLGLDTNIVKQTSKYHDVAYFAKRYKKPLLVLNGYKDEVTPASSVFAAFNQFKGMGVILHEREIGHDYTIEYWFGRYAFFKQHLIGFENPFDFKKSFDIKAGDNRLNVSTDTVLLRGAVAIDGAANESVSVRWEKIEGFGSVAFETPNQRQTSAKFSLPGTYLLRFSATYDYKINTSEPMFYTLSNYISIEIKEKTGAGTTPKDTMVSAVEKEKKLLRISPNPFSSAFQVAWEPIYKYKTIRIYDTIGHLHNTVNIPSGQLSVTVSNTNMPDGTYFVELENVNGRRISMKVVKSEK